MKKLQYLKIGEVFKYELFDWIKLDDLEDGTLAIMKDRLPDTRRFDEDSNNWRNSELRNWLNNNFLHTLIDNGAKEDNFLRFERDLTADDGMKDYGNLSDRLSLITCEEYRKYRNLIPIINNWWWTLTPYSCVGKYSCYVRCVYTDGSLNDVDANIACTGIRPICNLKHGLLVSTIEDKELLERIDNEI